MAKSKTNITEGHREADHQSFSAHSTGTPHRRKKGQKRAGPSLQGKTAGGQDTEASFNPGRYLWAPVLGSYSGPSETVSVNVTAGTINNMI